MEHPLCDSDVLRASVQPFLFDKYQVLTQSNTGEFIIFNTNH
ncbi:hypothetical protein C408_2068 [Vibrio diabolicus E0666]|nr:hypothetical protein C408_2068 [Vibrio diabolicus E0666]